MTKIDEVLEKEFGIDVKNSIKQLTEPKRKELQKAIIGYPNQTLSIRSTFYTFQMMTDINTALWLLMLAPAE